MKKEYDPMNPLHWNREQWMDAVRSLVLTAILWMEFCLAIWIFK